MLRASRQQCFWNWKYLIPQVGQDFTKLNYSAHFERRRRIKDTSPSSPSVVQTGLITKCTKVLLTSSIDAGGARESGGFKEKILSSFSCDISHTEILSGSMKAGRQNRVSIGLYVRSTIEGRLASAPVDILHAKTYLNSSYQCLTFIPEVVFHHFPSKLLSFLFLTFATGKDNTRTRTHITTLFVCRHKNVSFLLVERNKFWSYLKSKFHKNICTLRDP
jgi:hypothetical protein